ncbi:MAG: M48 family metalloprotease [Bacteroidota bacterium]
MNKSITAVLIIIQATLTVAAYSQVVDVTRRAKNDVREGPGSYYPLLMILPSGVRLEVDKRDGSWVNFKFYDATAPEDAIKILKGGDAWISKNSLLDKKKNNSLNDFKAASQKTPVTGSTIAAAIRGFALRYGATSGPALDTLEMFDSTHFVVDDYRSFIGKIPRPEKLSPEEKEVAQRYLGEYELSPEQEGIGLGIAARVAANGLNDNRELNNYVNLISSVLAEYSGAYDRDFRVLILRSSDINAISLPGGYIFITEGMMRVMQSESELAAVIAHEMMHIILKHGFKEIGKQKEVIRAENADQELDAEVGKVEDSVTVSELEEFAQDANEIVSKPRLLEYEYEADRGAVILLRCAGYDPTSIMTMVRRMRNIVGGYSEAERDNPFVKMDFQKRLTKVEEFLNKYFPQISGAPMTARFEREIQNLH